MKEDESQRVNPLEELRKASELYVASLRGAVESMEERLKKYHEMIETREDITGLAGCIRSALYTFPHEFNKTTKKAENAYSFSIYTHTEALKTLERLAQED